MKRGLFGIHCIGVFFYSVHFLHWDLGKDGYGVLAFLLLLEVNWVGLAPLGASIGIAQQNILLGVVLVFDTDTEASVAKTLVSRCSYLTRSKARFRHSEQNSRFLISI